MWNPLWTYRQHKARRRYVPRPRVTRASTTAVVAVAALALILMAAALLDLRGASEEEEALAAYLRERATEPLALIEAAGRAHRYLFIADIAGTSAPERLAMEAIGRLARGPGLDAVALYVDRTAQPAIDRYLASTSEDVAPLLSTSGALGADADAHLAVYRRIRALNDSLGADRRIRIVALAPEGGAPASPARAATNFAYRDELMLETIDERILERQPRARILFLVDGFSALRDGGAIIHAGGTTRLRTSWLAARLAARTPGEVFSIVVDAPGGTLRSGAAASYTGTGIRDLAASALAGRDAAVRTSPLFRVGGQPIRWAGMPGVQLTLDTVPLHRMADAYVFLGR